MGCNGLVSAELKEESTRCSYGANTHPHDHYKERLAERTRIAQEHP